jgi:hypothetical protein
MRKTRILMPKIPYRFLLGMAVMGWPASAHVLTLTPSGTVSGPPGATAGWGYSITNSSSQYMVIVNSYFCESGQDPLFTTCTQSLGSYSDFIASKATVIAPMSTATVSFNAQASLGLGAYAIRNSVTAGQSDSGSIVVEYDLYTANPFTDPTAQLVGGDAELTASAVVLVTSATITSVPTLSNWALAALAVLLIASATRQLSGSGQNWRGGTHRPRG